MCLEDFNPPVTGSFLHEDRKLDTCALTNLLFFCVLYTHAQVKLNFSLSLSSGMTNQSPNPNNSNLLNILCLKFIHISLVPLSLLSLSFHCLWPNSFNSF